MAKIPTILEAGRADGILIKTDNVYDDNKKKFLSDKLEEIDNNHNILNNTVKSLSNTVNNNELDIENKLAGENTRAIEAETEIKTNLETKLETEKTRAISVENTLKENIDTLTVTVNTNKSNINTKLQEEIARATNAESAIDAKVEAEQVRATIEENNLKTNINNLVANQESLSNAENIKVKTLSNTSANNVQQALNELFKNSTFCGIATPTTNPGTLNSSVFYFANQEGTYTNFNNIKVLKGESAILKWSNNTWIKTTFNPITTFNSVFNTEGNNLNTIITNINKEVDILSEQQISYVSPCFANCSDSHEFKLQSISLASNNIPSKRIFSITIKLADNLTLLNYSPVYMHLKDSVGNYIGVSQNAIKQVYNKGKYVTWFFDAAINSTNNPIIIKLHTTNSMSDASDSNRIGIIAHVKQTNDINGSGVTTFDGVYHQGWITAIGINVVNISAIYPQIKELQKYRMAYATSELHDISTTGHKANINEIRINQNVMGISLVNSISLMVANDNAYSGELYLKIHDMSDNIVASSNNSVNLSQNLGKYVTWYFTPFQLNTDAEYRFTAWNGSNVKQVMRIHVASGKNEGVTCLDQNNSPYTDYCPALGINISAIIADDLNKSIKNVNLALGKEILINSSDINNLEEAMEEVLYDIGQIKDNIEIASSTIIELEASALGITSDTTLTEGTLIDVYSGESGGGVLSTAITLNVGQTITSSANNNILALTVFAGNVIGRIKHRVLQVGEINYTANEPMSVYVCYRPQGVISTEVKVRDRTQLEEQITQKADTGYVNAQVKILTTALETKIDKVDGKGLSTNDYTNIEKTKLEGIESGANKTIVDASLSNTSSNPVQNKIINAALLGKANTAHSHTFSQILEKPTTLEGYGITDAEVKGASNTALTLANSYTDNKIATIINGAPETLDTLKEIADAMEKNESVVEALNQAIGTKATKDEFTSHSTNTDIHINSEERIKWNDSYNKCHIHTNKSVLDSTTASYTSEEKTKLAGVAIGANKTIVDTELSITSTNPVQNKVVATKLNNIKDNINSINDSISNINSSKASATYVDNKFDLSKDYTNTAKREVWDSIQNGSVFSNVLQLQVGNTIHPYAIHASETPSQFGGVYLPMNYYISNVNKELYLYDNVTNRYITAKWNENLSVWKVTNIDEGLPEALAEDTPNYPYVLSAAGICAYLSSIYEDAYNWTNALEARINALEARIAALEAK